MRESIKMIQLISFLTLFVAALPGPGHRDAPDAPSILPGPDPFFPTAMLFPEQGENRQNGGSSGGHRDAPDAPSILPFVSKIQKQVGAQGWGPIIHPDADGKGWTIQLPMPNGWDCNNLPGCEFDLYYSQCHCSPDNINWTPRPKK